MTALTIVPFSRRHIEEMAAVERACFSCPWSSAQLAEELTNPFAVYLVALAEDGQIAGYGGAHLIFGEMYITNIAVVPALRRRGVAAALLSALLAKARSKGARLATLEVRASNEPAKALYRRFGFETAGVRKNYYEKPVENAEIMTLWL